MANWLNPVTDFINAAKSGADVGATIAKLQNDKQEAAAKLAQSADAEQMQNALGYAQLRAKQEESQQEAAAKLQAALEQNAALNAYRQGRLEQGDQSLNLKSDAADALNTYRQGRLEQFDTRLGQHDRQLDQAGSRLDQGQQRIDARAKQNEATNALRQQANDLAASRNISAGDKALLNVAEKNLAKAQAVTMDVLTSPTSPAYTNALKTISEAKAVIDGYRSKAATATPTPTPSAADALTGFNPVMGQRQLADNASMPGATQSTGSTNAVDALTPATATTPAPTPATNAPAAKGRKFTDKSGTVFIYTGDADPATDTDPSHWQAE